MSSVANLVIADCPMESRSSLDWILEESFEGLYLRHSKRTLREIETVRVATAGERAVGLSMLKKLDARTGYVFYVAVAKAQRRKGVAGTLLDDALSILRHAGVVEVYASVEQDNDPSLALFRSRGFTKTGFGEITKKRGALGALLMYRDMVAVPGEMLLHKLSEDEQNTGK